MAQSKLETFGKGLGAIVNKCYHYRAPENVSGPYSVWMELGGLYAAGNNLHAERGMEIAVDYYTKTEFDPTIDSIEGFFAGMSWRLESVQFEEETGYIHYEWRVEYA